MKKVLSKIWQVWKKIGIVMGNIVSGIILTVFYFTIFAVFALPYRFFSRSRRDKDTVFILKKETISSLEEFKNE